MRVISEERLAVVLGQVPQAPRVVAGGYFAAPLTALAVLDGAVPAYRLFMLNAPVGIPDRSDVILERPFVGAGMRRRPNLRCRRSISGALRRLRPSRSAGGYSTVRLK